MSPQIKRLPTFFLLLCLLALAACQKEETAEPTAQLPVLNDTLNSINKIASPAEDETVLDATPDPDGHFVYYTTSKGVYKVPAGGGDPTLLASGSPLTTPWGLAISSDGQTLYIADPGSNTIFLLPAGGGQPTALPGTQDTTPRVPEIVTENGSDQLYYSGLSDNQPAILKIAPAGATPTVIYKGSPLVEPSGVTVSHDGTVYVIDRTASSDGSGSLFRISGGTIEAIANNIRTGDPLSGITLLQDESILLVSALSQEQGTAEVIMVNLSTLELALFNKVIGNNSGAAGLHRAHNGNFFAWADYHKFPGQGGIYFLEP